MSLLEGTTVSENSSSKPAKVLSNSDVCRKVNLSSSSLWRYVKSGLFPASIELGPNRVGWIESEVDAWIEAKAQNRGGV